MEWLNKDLIKNDSIGFVYIIKHKENGKYYIGKKNLKTFKTIKGKKIYKESNWNTYMGSNKTFLDYIKQEGKEMFIKEILIVCKSSIELTYQELKYLILFDWESDLCFNQNLLGKIFKSKIK